LVRGRRPPHVVLGRQAVDRHDNRDAREHAPCWRNLPDGTGYELNVNAASGKDRQNGVEFAVSHKRLTTDDRNVQWPVLVDQTQDSVNQCLPLEIAKLTKRGLATQVIVVIRITARASQRTFAGNLNGKRRMMARQNPAPRTEYAFQMAPRSRSTS